jgi:autotransporter strand-loop-strand O-heptosyltransferase
MKTILFITPHLSTGGLPQYLLKKVTVLKNTYNIFVIEYDDITGGKFIVQKKRLFNLLGDNLITIPPGTEKQLLISAISKINPDIIHFEEMPEYFMGVDIALQIYKSDRTYKIFETCHDSSFNPDRKRFKPDKFILVSEYQVEMLAPLKVHSEVVEYPIEFKDRTDRTAALNKLGLSVDYKHILNIGLFTPGKNQSKFFDYAREFEKQKVIFHCVGNMADNFRDYWEPLLSNKRNNVVIHGEKDNVDDYYAAMDLFLFTSIKETMPLVVREAISHRIPTLIYNLPVYRNYFNKYNNLIHYLDFNDFNKDVNIINSLLSKDRDEIELSDSNSTLMRDSLIKIYEETTILNIKQENKINITFVNGAKVDITGTIQSTYSVEFINQETNLIEYRTTIATNNWSESSKKYFVNWLINVYENDKLIYTHKYNATGKRVYITMESKAMGDTIAWFPFIDEFRKQHNCKLIVSTFHNDWFQEQYPEIEFVNPGQTIHNLYAMYRIGWFFNDDKINYDLNRVDFRAIPLQQTASSILGLPPAEIKPKLTVPTKNTNIEGKYVVIAPHASAHAKYWNHQGGWQIVINWLITIGYKVVMLTSEKLGDINHDSKLGGKLYHVIDKTGDIAIQDRMVDIKGAELFIGLSSGLSWLSWVLGTKTILISGFSEPYTEFNDCVRVFTNKPYTCNGCSNKRKLNANDWGWCPEHKDTNRQFECTKTIMPQQIINEINNILL